MTLPADRTDRPESDGVRRHALFGLALVLATVGGFGAWAATTHLAGAVLAGGTTVVESSVKTVKHQTGGIVGEILVADGDRVAAGAVLIRLDETLTRANLQIVAGQLDRTRARLMRLRAERDGLTAMPQSAAAGPVSETAYAGETAYFASRRAALDGEKAQLVERVAQLRREADGLAAQRGAAAEQAGLVERELAEIEPLFAERLVSQDRLSGLRREAARLRGEVGRLDAATAETAGRIVEVELQALQLEGEFRKEAIRELRDEESREAELAERMVAAEDQLRRVDIRAPQAGIVHGLAVHTVGGVIAPGEQLLQIVPEGEALVVEAHVQPQDIASVRPGQAAVLRFPALDRTTPELVATVDRVSPDLVRDERSGLAFYVARIRLDAAATGLGLVPGMPVEAQIQTGERTALSYLMKPLTDQVARAFRER